MLTQSLINTGSGQDATLIVGKSCRLYGIDCMNNHASNVYYIKLYDKATAPSNSDTPVRRYMIPFGGGLVRLFDMVPLVFSSGLGFLISAGIADNDASNAPASTLLINIDWA